MKRPVSYSTDYWIVTETVTKDSKENDNESIIFDEMFSAGNGVKRKRAEKKLNHEIIPIELGKSLITFDDISSDSPHKTADVDIFSSDFPVQTTGLNVISSDSPHQNHDLDEISAHFPLEFTGKSVKKSKKPKNKRSKTKRDNENSCSTDQTNQIDQIDPSVRKYYEKRYFLFSKFDQGIKLDTEGWFSVTPESIACKIATHCACDVIIDAFCGVGGNAIQFALSSFHVIAIDIDPVRLEYAKNNAAIYGVQDRIEFILGDYLQLIPRLKADVVFLSPPWGGPEYINAEEYDLETMLKPVGASELIQRTSTITENIAFFVPRNTSCEKLSQLGEFCTIDLHYIGKKNYIKAITAYYGELAYEE